MNMTVKWVLCTDVEVEDDHVRVILDCGHSYEARPHWNSISIEDYYVIIAHMIGHNQRCPECEMAMEAEARDDWQAEQERLRYEGE